MNGFRVDLEFLKNFCEKKGLAVCLSSCFFEVRFFCSDLYMFIVKEITASNGTSH